MVGFNTQEQLQFKLAEKLGLGKANLSGIELLEHDMIQDKGYSELIEFIKKELR